MTQNEKWWMPLFKTRFGECYDRNGSGPYKIEDFIEMVESSTVDRVRREEREKAVRICEDLKYVLKRDINGDMSSFYEKTKPNIVISVNDGWPFNKACNDIAQAILKG